MNKPFRRALWNRAVAVAFGLPAVGYLAFLSQFWFGEPTGLVSDVLSGVFLFALPVMALYSALLDAVGPVNQTLGTAGFFGFAYLLAVAVALVVRHGVRFTRDRLPRNGAGSPNS